jgi:Glycosyltransferase family 87
VRPAGGWAAWAVVAALLSLGGLTHGGKRALEREIEAQGMPQTAAGLVRAVRAYLANDWDVQRAHAYVSAALGRPYRVYYVRPAVAWREAFLRGENPDPDATPVVMPGRPLVPYRDFAVEYPPGFFLWATPPALLAAGADSYRVVYGLEMALCLTLALLLCVGLQRAFSPSRPLPSVPAWAAGGALLLGVVVMNRLDATVALAVTLAVWAAVRQRPGLSGLALGLAVVTKVVPAVLLPLLALAWWRAARGRGLGRGLAGAAAGVFVPVLPFVGRTGGGAMEALAYHAARPLQVETSAAALLGLLHSLVATSLQTVSSYGSLNLQGTGVWLATLVSSCAAVLGLLAVYGWAFRAERNGAGMPAVVLAGALAALVVCFALGKVFSPQYLVWLLPLGTLASCLAGTGRRVALLLVCLLSQLIFPIAYAALAELSPWAFVLVGLRNALLLAWAGSLLSWAAASAQLRAPSTKK